MKKILFVCNNLIYGGIPRSLISLLREIKDDYDIDLMLFWQGGEYLDEVPEGVKLLPSEGLLPLLGMPQSVTNRHSAAEGVVRAGFVGWSRLVSNRGPRKITLATTPVLKGYDIAVSYAQDNSGRSYAIGCNDFVLERVEADVKVAFVHCDYLRYGGNDKLTRRQYRRFDRIACVSKSAKKSLLNALPELRGRTYVVENCTDFEGIRKLAEEPVEPYGADVEATSAQDTAIKPAEAEPDTVHGAAAAEEPVTAQGAATAEEPSTDNIKLNMITVSRLTKEKAHVRAIRVIKDISLKYPGLTWTIVGDGPCMKEIVYAARDAGILGRVFMLGAQANPYPYMKKADFFFLPSLHEAAPMVFGEARALELPVLTTDTCTAAKHLEEEGIGLVCPNSEEGLREGLERICSDPSVLDRMRGVFKNKNLDNSRQKAQFERMLEGVRRPRFADIGEVRQAGNISSSILYSGYSVGETVTDSVNAGMAGGGRNDDGLTGEGRADTGTVWMEGVSDGTVRMEGYGDGTACAEGHGDGTVRMEGYGDGTVRMEGYGDGTVRMEGVGDGTACADRNSAYGIGEDISARHVQDMYPGQVALSIIVPVYNRKNIVRRCAESLLNQDFKDYEIIFVDDGSDDGTAEVLERIVRTGTVRASLPDRRELAPDGAKSGGAGGMAAGDTAGGNTAGDTAGSMTAGGNTAGGNTAGGDTAGGDTAGGSSCSVLFKDADKKSPRMLLIRQENRGVACARNTGLAAASGKYVTWVDSDDWIEQDSLSHLWDRAERWDADVLLFDGWEVSPEGIKDYSASEAAFHLSEGRLARSEYLLTRPCPWNKWIKREILGHRPDCPDFHFPEGEIYEDLSLIPTLAMRTDRIYYTKRQVYHYWQSEGSIMRQDGWNENMRGIFRAVRRLQKALARDFPEEVEYLWWLHLLLNSSARFLDCGMQDMAEKAARWMKKYYPSWRKNPYVRRSSRGARLSGELLATRNYAAYRRYRKIAGRVKAK